MPFYFPYKIELLLNNMRHVSQKYIFKGKDSPHSCLKFIIVMIRLAPKPTKIWNHLIFLLEGPLQIIKFSTISKYSWEQNNILNKINNKILHPHSIHIVESRLSLGWNSYEINRVKTERLLSMLRLQHFRTVFSSFFRFFFFSSKVNLVAATWDYSIAKTR